MTNLLLTPRHAELVSASIVPQTQSMNGEMDPGAKGVQRTNKFRVTMRGTLSHLGAKGVQSTSCFSILLLLRRCSHLQLASS
jgi:hypothetical protein